MNSGDAPGASRVERKKEETRQKIVAAALRLFDEHGIDATTMESIAEQADIAKGTLYHYFPTKEAILNEYIQRSFKDKHPARIATLQELPGTRARMRLILGQLVGGIQGQKEVFEKYLVHRVQTIISLRKSEAERSGIELLESEIILLGQKSGEIRSDLPLFVLEDLFEFILVALVKQMFAEPENFDASQAIERAIDLFLNGAARPPSEALKKREKSKGDGTK